MAVTEDERTELEGERAPEGTPEPAESQESPETAELRKRCDELEQTVAQLKDQLLRKAAEFDNYRKRTEAESASIVKFANEDLLLKLLPVVDDLERSFRALSGSRSGIDGAPAADGSEAAARKEAAFISGMELIHGKLRKTLEQVGLSPFDSVGKPFDPEVHDALLQVPRSDMPHHTVVEEIDRGYQLNGRIVRHARVIVSSNPAEGEA